MTTYLQYFSYATNWLTGCALVSVDEGRTQLPLLFSFPLVFIARIHRYSFCSDPFSFSLPENLLHCITTFVSSPYHFHKSYYFSHYFSFSLATFFLADKSTIFSQLFLHEFYSINSSQESLHSWSSFLILQEHTLSERIHFLTFSNIFASFVYLDSREWKCLMRAIQAQILFKVVTILLCFPSFLFYFLLSSNNNNDEIKMWNKK